VCNAFNAARATSLSLDAAPELFSGESPNLEKSSKTDRLTQTDHRAGSSRRRSYSALDNLSLDGLQRTARDDDGETGRHAKRRRLSAS
jgi:hypothetical protein